MKKTETTSETRELLSATAFVLKSPQSCPAPCQILWTEARQAPLSMGFPRQGYWSGGPCPPPGDLFNPGMEPRPLMAPALAGGFFTTSAAQSYVAACREGVCGRMGACVCLTESPHCAPETIPAWLIGYTSIQNKKVFRNKKLMHRFPKTVKGRLLGLREVSLAKWLSSNVTCKLNKTWERRERTPDRGHLLIHSLEGNIFFPE